ncbi:MAG: DUF2791 family P-loop domain-containing protein [Chloroflexi bacterium]|nr:DUF2791 family P-loop domain-containing protein [Chloroflexota bacterium]
MLGAKVQHPEFGEGQVMATYRNGRELLVRFANGLRFRRPAAEFSRDGKRLEKPSPAMPALHEGAAPMPKTQLEARHLIESLRLGIAPAQHVAELTVDLQVERASILAGLNQAHQHGGDVRAIVGEYGYGKSHIVELTTQEALSRNFGRHSQPRFAGTATPSPLCHLSGGDAPSALSRHRRTGIGAAVGKKRPIWTVFCPV